MSHGMPRQRWSGWVGDRDLETAIRRTLDDDGYGGSMAEIVDSRLAGTVSPGWIQVSSFHVVAKHLETGEKHPLWGVSREDERQNESMVCFFRTSEERDTRLREWTEGMITVEGQRGRKRSALEVGLLVVFAVLAAIAILSAVMTRG